MYNIVRKNGSAIKASFHKEEDAKECLANMGPQRNFFTIEHVEDLKPVVQDSPQDEFNKGAIRITRQNVKHFYKKEGIIKVFSPNGKLLHTGKTTNMGKVCSNYVNCAKYNQSYDFDIDGGDILMFKEQPLKS